MWRRAAAAGVDLAVGFAAAFLLRSTIGMFFARRAVLTLRIDEPDTLWKGPVPLVLGTFGEITYLLPLTLFAAWALDPLTGATLGKRLLSLRVRAADGRPASPRSRWTRFFLQTTGLWGWTLALLAGRWEIAALASAAGIVMLAGCLYDRVTGTSVRGH